MSSSIQKTKSIKEALKMACDIIDPEYTITCEGRIMMVTDSVLSDEKIDELDIGRVDAFKGSHFICMDKEYANAIADLLEGKDDSGMTPFQKEAVEYLFDAVNGIQYQSMIKWIDEYRKHEEEI